MTTRRRLIFAGVGALLLLIIVFALRPTSLAVETATVATDSLTVSVAADGQTRVRDRFVIAAPSTGRVRRISLKEGAQVSVGDIVARLEPAPQDARTAAEARARVSAAEAARGTAAASLDQAKAVAAQAAAEAARRRTLAEAGALSREAMEQAQLAATEAEQQREMAESGLRQAAAEVAAARAGVLGAGGTGGIPATVEVRSPVAGRVLRVPDPSERVVMAGAPLIELGDLDGLEIVIDLLSQDAARVAAGAPVTITDWGGDTDLHGTVTRVEPDAFTKVSALGVEEQRVNVIADLRDLPSALGAGFRVEARIVTWAGADVLQVPTSALFQGRGGWELFVMSEGKARLRSVGIGHRSDAMAEITEGIKAGEVVILYPSDELSDGTRVKARK
ncbi:MAG TPA: HlyD family efflux transporter periplasmic adaptor subunit [Gemmatimonadales bacterium]|nr:HlyD family efflux transporter periplasmic adaptor subunit [Gemmatimonadales bacterium]